jgi:hypothetical protein
MTGHFDNFRIRSKLPRTDKLNLAVSNMYIRDSVDPLFGVNDMRAFQNKRAARGIHASTPCELQIYSIKLQ